MPPCGSTPLESLIGRTVVETGDLVSQRIRKSRKRFYTVCVSRAAYKSMEFIYILSKLSSQDFIRNGLPSECLREGSEP